MMNEAWTDAWILYSIVIATAQDGKARLTDVIAAADAMNKAIPSQYELNTSIGRLSRQGYITREGRTYRITEKGDTLVRSSQGASNTLFDTWDNLTERLAGVPNAVPHDITTEEHAKAYKQYTKEFWKEQRKKEQESTKRPNKAL